MNVCNNILESFTESTSSTSCISEEDDHLQNSAEEDNRDDEDNVSLSIKRKSSVKAGKATKRSKKETGTDRLANAAVGLTEIIKNQQLSRIQSQNIQNRDFVVEALKILHESKSLRS